MRARPARSWGGHREFPLLSWCTKWWLPICSMPNATRWSRGTVTGLPTLVNESDRIYVAGHTGLAGSAICRQLAARSYRNVVTRAHADLDLTSQNAVEQ